MKIGNAGHAILTEARRHVWALRPEVWDSFSRLLTLEELPVKVEREAKVANARRAKRAKATGVAVVPLQGIITPKPSILSALFGGSGLSTFRSALRAAVADEDVSAIVLDVDSPGGSTALVEEAAADIRAARERKPVVAVANVDAGSAAYWLAAQASEVSITPSGMVGSVGAFILHLDYSGANEKAGIEPTYITAGRFKVEGNPDEALTDEAEAHLQSIVDETHATFIRDLAAGRGVTERSVRAGFGEGRMLTAGAALAAGMADRVETLEAAVERMLEGESSSVPSGRRASLTRADEAEHEEPEGLSSSRKSRIEDEALADEAIASLTR